MILLDTCTFLWMVSNQPDLSASAKKMIQDNPNQLYISSISAFEIGIKVQKGKLILPEKTDAWFEPLLDFHQIIEIPVTSKIAILATQLPPIHADPFDRILVATAQLHQSTLLTPDSAIRQYSQVKTAW